MADEVKFYRGNYERFAEHNDPDSTKNEIIFINDAIDNPSGDKTIGSIYQDQYIVGTTRADELRLTSNLEVLDGPLADETKDNWPDEWYENGQRIIPKGKSMEDILKGLFMRELFGTVSWNAPVWNPSLGDPSITCNYGETTLSNNSTLEVGSVVSFEYETSNDVSDNTRICTLNAKYGYFREVDGSYEWYPGGDSVCEQKKEGSVGGELVTTLEWGKSNNISGITSTEKLVVGEGSHKLKISLSGITASAPGFDPVTVWASTNTKKRIGGSEVSTNTTKPGDKSLTSDSEFNVTGKYKYFIGCYDDSTFTNKVYTSDSIRSTDVKESGWMNGTNINCTITIPVGTKGMYIAIPSGVDDNGSKLKVKQVNTNAYVNSEMVTNSKPVTINCGGTHTKDYKVFTWSFPQGTIGEESFEITSF